MALAKTTAGSGPNTTYVEYSGKHGAFVQGFGDQAEHFQIVSGTIDTMWIEDPMSPPAGKPRKANAEKIPVKLVVRLADGSERVAIKFPLHTTEDKNIGFGAAKVVAQLYGTLLHHFTETEAKRPSQVQLRTGLGTAAEGADAASWFVADSWDGEAWQKKAIQKVWGFNADDTPNLGDPKVVDGQTTYGMPSDFTETFRDKTFVKFDKVWKLVQDMVAPFEAERAARRQNQGQAHSSHDAGIDPDAVDEAQDAMRQRG